MKKEAFSHLRWKTKAPSNASVVQGAYDRLSSEADDPMFVSPGLISRIKSQIQTKVEGRFRIREIAAIDHRNWMSMITLPGNTSRRFRCTDGIIVDEITVGD